MGNDESPMYYVSDAIKFICSRSDFSEDVVGKVLQLEDDYMRSIGIIVDPSTLTKDELLNYLLNNHLYSKDFNDMIVGEWNKRNEIERKKDENLDSGGHKYLTWEQMNRLLDVIRG